MGVCIDVHFEGSSVTKENSTFLPHNFKMRGCRLTLRCQVHDVCVWDFDAYLTITED